MEAVREEEVAIAAVTNFHARTVALKNNLNVSERFFKWLILQLDRDTHRRQTLLVQHILDQAKLTSPRLRLKVL